LAKQAEVSEHKRQAEIVAKHAPELLTKVELVKLKDAVQTVSVNVEKVPTREMRVAVYYKKERPKTQRPFLPARDCASTIIEDLTDAVTYAETNRVHPQEVESFRHLVADLLDGFVKLLRDKKEKIN
jgi:hypothetical protein